MAEAKGALKAKEIEEFGVRLTIFDNGDVYVSTPADIHIIKARHVLGVLTAKEVSEEIERHRDLSVGRGWVVLSLRDWQALKERFKGLD